MPKFSALEVALNSVWAMESGALETLLTIAAREHEVTPEALEAYRAKTLADAEQAQIRDGVAILNVNGALIKRASFFSAISGASSYDLLRRDFQAAIDNPKVKGVLFNIDSPGGEASGVGELASAVWAARDVKPIRVYVNGEAASAAYWLAAAAGPGNVVIDSTAMLGSIGVQVAMREREDAKGTTTYRFISSQSPMKNAAPGSEEGAAEMQRVVDAMAQVFVENVAEYRGVSTQTVLSNFGKGGIFVGMDAIKAGLADRIGNFEGVLAELSAPRGKSKARANEGAMIHQTNRATVNSRVSPITGVRAVADTRSREEKIRALAVGAPMPLPPGRATKAIVAGTTVTNFALQVADYCAMERAARRADAELSAVAKRIANSDQTRAEFPSSGDAELDALAKRIAAA